VDKKKIQTARQFEQAVMADKKHIISDTEANKKYNAMEPAGEFMLDKRDQTSPRFRKWKNNYYEESAKVICELVDKGIIKLPNDDKPPKLPEDFEIPGEILNLNPPSKKPAFQWLHSPKRNQGGLTETDVKY
jgi:hypothetical protein